MGICYLCPSVRVGRKKLREQLNFTTLADDDEGMRDEKAVMNAECRVMN